MTNMIRSEQPQEDSTPRFSSAYLITGAIIGIVLGLILSLAFFRMRWVDITPKHLTNEALEDYVSAVALSYYAENDLGRARARLETIESDMTLPLFVNSFGSNIRSEDGGPSLRMRAVYWLASDLSGGTIDITGLDLLEDDTEEAVPTEEAAPEEESAIPATQTPQAQAVPTATEESIAEEVPEEETPLAEDLNPPDPTPVAIAVNEQPFQLTERLNFCDQKLSQQLQVEVLDEDGVPLQGVKVYVQWDGGNETFYTGLYPEISDGYADYAMAEDVIYQLQVGGASLFIEDIQPNVCSLDDGSSYFGGVWLKFRPQSES